MIHTAAKRANRVLELEPSFASKPYASIEATQRVIFVPTVADVRNWNHGALLTVTGDSLLLLWASGARDEAAAGACVLASWSHDEGITWSEPEIAVPPFEPTDLSHTLLATNTAPETVLTLPDGRSFVAYDITSVTPDDIYTPIGVAAHELGADWPEPKWIHAGDDSLEMADAATARVLRNALIARGRVGRSALALSWRGKWPHSANEQVFIETVSLPLLNGAGWVRYGRGYGTEADDKLLYQFSANGADYQPIGAAVMDHAPSLVAGLIHSSGKRLLAWNQEGVRNPLLIGVSDDALNWNAIYVLRDDASEPEFPGYAKWGGPSYPSLCEISDGRVACAYSIAKERIEISIFSL